MLQFAISFALLSVSGTAYFWWVRPIIMRSPAVAAAINNADGFFARLWARLRAQWDGFVGIVLIVGPEIPGALAEIQGTVDMTSFLPGETAKRVNQGIGLALILLRAFVLKKTS